MNSKVVVVASVLALGGLIAALYWLPAGIGSRSCASTRSTTGPAAAGGGELLVYCAAAIRKPVEAAAAQYERDVGVRIQLQFGGSQTLLANAKLANAGDLYIPADDGYLDLARNEGLLAESAPLATMRPTLAVKIGNPRGIRSLDDATGESVRIGLADPKAAAIGRVARDTLMAAGKWDAVERRVVVTKPTVNDVATDVQLGTIDAAFVWDVTIKQMAGELEAVPVPELQSRVTTVSVGVLRTSADPTAALRFLRYLASSDKGRPHFERAGFAVAAPPAGGALLPAALDAVAAHLANAPERGEGLAADTIDILRAVAVRRTGIGRATSHPPLAARLMAALRSADSRARFEAWGFRWEGT